MAVPEKTYIEFNVRHMAGAEATLLMPGYTLAVEHLLEPADPNADVDEEEEDDELNAEVTGSTFTVRDQHGAIVVAFSVYEIPT